MAEKVELSGDLAQWFHVLREARLQVKEWGEREKEAKSAIAQILGSRDTDVQYNGKTLLHAVNRPGSVTLNAARLKVEMPDIYERYKKLNAGSYRLEFVTDDE